MDVEQKSACGIAVQLRVVITSASSDRLDVCEDSAPLMTMAWLCWRSDV
jgi:hypothetical protein